MLEQNKNYVTILLFDLVFNKKRKQRKDPTSAPMKKGSNNEKETVNNNLF